MAENIYWVGPRESDISSSADFFAGSITIYGSKSHGNTAYCNDYFRINHNIDNPSPSPFIEEQLTQLLSYDSNARLLFYDKSQAYNYSKQIQNRVVGLLPEVIYHRFGDKLRTRELLHSVVQTVPYVNIEATELLYKDLQNYFISSKYVIQEKISSGGEGTYVMSSESDPIRGRDNIGSFLISPYIEDAIPINTHIFITETQVVVYPSSVQLCQKTEEQILYYGADYDCFNRFLSKYADEISSMAQKVGHLLCRYGYRGVAGVDWIISDEEIYLLEINPRYQASTDLLNMALKASDLPSLFEMEEMYFKIGEVPTIPKDFVVPYSNYVFTDGNSTFSHISTISSAKEVEAMQWDGFDYQKDCEYQEHPYLCRAVFKRNISSIWDNQLRLHPNLCITSISDRIFYNKHPDISDIKIALINHGVRITDSALFVLEKKGSILKAVFDAVDILIYNTTYVNTPYNCAFSDMSPFCIDASNDRMHLYYDGKYLCETEVSILPKTLVGNTTKHQIPYESIMQLATDRIRINPAPVCIYKTKGISCKFCNLPCNNDLYNLEDIYEVIETCLASVDFRHFLIGGGTISDDDSGWHKIISIVEYIRQRCQKDIYLMCIPPRDLSFLDRLKSAGVTEIAFNLEIFDRDMARAIMPGKGRITRENYNAAFYRAIELWGNTGNVRSLIIYGFDKDNIFLEGIESLCRIGVEPIISAFRPLNGTELYDQIPPNTISIIDIFHRSSNVAAEYNLILGPNCLPCRNNTISSVL